MRTALGLILRAKPQLPEPEDKPAIKEELLVRERRSPTKMRKGKSGERRSSLGKGGK